MKGARLTVCILSLVSACTQPEASDRPDGPVVDAADIIPAEREARLDRKLRDYTAQSGNAIVVSSVPSLKGETIEAFANRTFNDWGIGDAETNRGLLILVARDDRQVRIEVGRGLNCTITGPVAGRIIQDKMIPLFKAGDMAGDMAGATEAGVDGLIRDVAKGPVNDPMFPGCKQELDKAA